MALQTGPDPNALLTTALEKLLYLESRLEAAESAREDAVRDRDRHRDAATKARRQLDAWQRRAADAQVAAEGADREAKLLRAALGDARLALHAAPDEDELRTRLTEAEERLERYAREREAWLDRMVALGRLRSPDDALDLGSFIAELRQELLALRRGDDADRVRATMANRPPAPDARALLAEAPAPELDPEALVHAARHTRPERTLALLCARDLASETPTVRRRAVERLAEARLATLNPWIIQQLPRETDAHVRAAMLVLLDATAGDGATVVLENGLRDADARVRAAAVDLLARRRWDFSAALQDPSPAIRRRALELLPRSGDAVDRLADALRDDDASVRKVALTLLARRPGAEVDAVLQIAAHGSDPVLTPIARDALALRGVPLDDRAVLAEPVAGTTQPPETTPVFDDAPPAAEPVSEPVPEPVVAAAEPVPEPPPASLPVDVEEPAPPLDAEDDPLAQAILDEVQTALRGRTIEELVLHLQQPIEAIGATAERLVGDGRLLWRGRKLYQP